MDYIAKQRGERLFHARINAVWTIEELAQRSGVAPGIIQSIEQGGIEMTEQQAQALAPSVNVSVRFLLSGMI